MKSMHMHFTGFLILIGMILGTIFVACGDDITEINRTNSIYAQYHENLPDCDVSKTGMIFYDGNLFFCSDSLWISLDGKDGVNGNNGRDGVFCITEAIDLGQKILCDGDSVGIIRNGIKNPDSTGKNGTYCITKEAPLEFEIFCGDEKIGSIHKGQEGLKGDSGINGKGCSYKKNKDGSYTEKCEDNEFIIFGAICGTHIYNIDSHFCSGIIIYEKCNNSDYNTITHFCGADNKIVEKCNNQAYNTETEFCGSDDKIHEKCGGKIYSQDVQFCSDDSIYNKCDGMEFDVDKEFCGEDDKLHDKCGNQNYDVETLFCGSDNTPHDLCGNLPYDIETENCCNNTIYSIDTKFCENGSVMDKCNGSTYSTVSEFCGEDDTIHNKCGSEIFNTETEFCGSDEAVYSKCGGNDYDVINEACCNNVTYTLETQFCSAGKIYEKCNNAAFDVSSQFCGSDNTPHDLCGNLPYDIETENCCNNTIYSTDTKFCENGSVIDKCNGLTYSTVSEFCGADNKIHSKCGTKTYNTSTEACCNTTVYSTSTKFCSAGTLYDKCNGASFDPKLKFCSSNTLYNLCGTKTYTPSTQSCCNGTIYTLSTHTCTNNVVTPKTVCGSTAYNASTQMCDTRKNKIYNIKKIGTQTWMTQDLAYPTGAMRCESYGCFYTMGNASKACPSGWHLPSKDEWMTLYNNTGKNANNLKATSAGGNNSSGMGLINPGYLYYLNGNFTSKTTAYWTSTAGGFGGYYFAGNTCYNLEASNGLLVRCVK